jgi:AbrB family looped-hinge helix DNA binding protein
MGRYVVSISSKGQITIPKEVRDRFKLRGKIIIVVDGNEVRLEAKSLLDEFDDLIIKDLKTEGVSNEMLAPRLAKRKKELAEYILKELHEAREEEGGLTLDKLEKELGHEKV